MQERSLLQLDEKRLAEELKETESRLREEEKREEARIALSRLIEAIRSGQIYSLNPTHFKPYDTAKLELVCRELEENMVCRRINLSGLGLVDSDIMHLANMLSKNRSIDSLFLDRNKITSEGPLAIAAAIESNPTLRLVSLDCNDLQVQGSDLSSFNQVARALGKLPSIRSLSLAYCGLSPDSIRILRDSLADSESIVSVDLSGNDLDDHAWFDIIQLCRRNQARMRDDIVRIKEELEWFTQEDRWATRIRSLITRESALVTELKEKYTSRTDEILHKRQMERAEIYRKQFEAGRSFILAYNERKQKEIPVKTAKINARK
jgi:hypothetical protein